MNPSRKVVTLGILDAGRKKEERSEIKIPKWGVFEKSKDEEKPVENGVVWFHAADDGLTGWACVLDRWACVLDHWAFISIFILKYKTLCFDGFEHL